MVAGWRLEICSDMRLHRGSQSCSSRGEKRGFRPHGLINVNDSVRGPAFKLIYGSSQLSWCEDPVAIFSTCCPRKKQKTNTFLQGCALDVLKSQCVTFKGHYWHVMEQKVSVCVFRQYRSLKMNCFMGILNI